MCLSNGEHGHLSRTEPERPFAARVLDQDSHHTLDRSQHGAVDDDGRVRLAISTIVLELEVDRQLEVQLNRSALVLALQSIRHHDVDFGAVECTVACVDSPGLTEIFQGEAKLVLSVIPKLEVSHVLLRSSRDAC